MKARSSARSAALAVLCLSVLLSPACSNREEQPAVGDPRYPQANPDPRDVLDIVVQAPDSLALAFEAEYVAQADKRACRAVLSRLEGASTQQRIRVPVPVTPTAEGQQVLHLAIDAFKPGDCRWAFDRLLASVGVAGQPDTMLEQGAVIAASDPSSPLRAPDSRHLNGDAAQAVVWRCYEQLSPDVQTGKPVQRCNSDVAEAGNKYQHRWQPDQRRLQLRIEQVPEPLAASVSQ